MAKFWRIVAFVLITAACIGVITAISSRPTSNDYIEYWSSANLFLHRSNPYSSSGVLALEKAHGFLLDSPLIMLNPPWALPLVAPLGFFPSLVGLVLWILIACGCIVGSMFLIDMPAEYRVIGFLFAPVIAEFAMQQSSPFLLLGFALFLRLYRNRPFLSGASLFLLTIKPHLFLVFWTILLIDCIYKRRFAVIAGGIAALAAVSALVTLWIPSVWRDYVELIRRSALDQVSFPTLPTQLRAWIDVRLTWLALVPVAIAIAWGVAYYWRRRESWEWKREGMLVMLVTVVASPYAWTSDQLVFLPAVSHALSLQRRRFSMELLVAINLAALGLGFVQSKYCIWIPLAWLGWYLYAVRRETPNDIGNRGVRNEREVLTQPS